MELNPVPSNEEVSKEWETAGAWARGEKIIDRT